MHSDFEFDACRVSAYVLTLGEQPPRSFDWRLSRLGLQDVYVEGAHLLCTLMNGVCIYCRFRTQTGELEEKGLRHAKVTGSCFISLVLLQS